MPGKMARSDPRPSVRVTRGAGSGQHLASVLQEGRENANIDAGLGFIWRIRLKAFVGKEPPPNYLADRSQVVFDDPGGAGLPGNSLSVFLLVGVWAWGRSGVHRGVPSSIVQDEPASNGKVGMNTSLQKDAVSIHADATFYIAHHCRVR